MKYAVILIYCFCRVQPVFAAKGPRPLLPNSLSCQSDLGAALIRGLVEEFPFKETKRISGDRSGSLDWMSSMMSKSGVAELEDDLEQFSFERSQKHAEVWLSWQQFTANKSSEQIAIDLEAKYIATGATIKTPDGQVTRTALGIFSAYEAGRSLPLLITELNGDHEIPLNPEEDFILIRVEK